MKRSNLLWRWLSLGLVLALIGCGVEPSGSAGAGEQAETKVYRWKLITTWPKNLPGLGLHRNDSLSIYAR